jgi:hypothetical protein
VRVWVDGNARRYFPCPQVCLLSVECEVQVRTRLAHAGLKAGSAACACKARVACCPAHSSPAHARTHTQDMVIGVVVDKRGEDFRLDIRGPTLGVLPSLSFEGKSTCAHGLYDTQAPDWLCASIFIIISISFLLFSMIFFQQPCISYIIHAHIHARTHTRTHMCVCVCEREGGMEREREWERERERL